MPLSKEAIRIILGIKNDICLYPYEMVKNLKITFFPFNKLNTSSSVINFSEKIKNVFTDLGIEIIPYNESLVNVPFKFKIKEIINYFLSINIFTFLKHILSFNFIDIKLLFSKIIDTKKIKKGIAIIVTGESSTDNLAVDHTMSFKENPIITIIDKPSEINNDSSFEKHMGFALEKFAWDITNSLITVNDFEWTLYSFNMSYPTYLISDDETLKKDVLNSLIPKIYAPVTPPKLDDFIIRKEAFNPHDNLHFPIIKDLINSGPLLDKTGLYPKPISIRSLKFRNDFYRLIGRIHLDKRSGMSYGFVAHQMPTKLSKLMIFDESRKKNKKDFNNIDYLIENKKIYVLITIDNKKYILQVPEVWVLTSRSGSDKTSLNIERDIIKVGLVNGEMHLDLPKRFILSDDYKPSFDTKIILSHAVTNAICASVLAYFQPYNLFSNTLENSGLAIVHWHGYILPSLIPKGWFVHGYENPPVSCSSPQAAVYAFIGKEKVVLESIKNKKFYIGDIHVEPQHGTNMIYKSLIDFVNFILSDNKISKLGNEYLNLYYYEK